jgi:hypothetical protein
MLNKKSIDLILEFEVGGGENYYNKFLKNPTWPGEQSGVTIGVGYDCGYVNKNEFSNDWKNLDQKNFDKLYKTVGTKGIAAKDLIKGVKDIIIPWDLALEVFMNKTVTKFYNLARDTFPNFDNLPEDAKGGIVSLVFNRGNSLQGDRRREMKFIYEAMKISPVFDQKTLTFIANQIRSMKRIWFGSSIEKGMIRRRDAEAELVEKAITSSTTNAQNKLKETDAIIRNIINKNS